MPEKVTEGTKRTKGLALRISGRLLFLPQLNPEAESCR